MLFSVNWLKRYVELPDDPDEVGEALTRCGLVVDQVETADGDTVFDLDVPTNRVDAMNHVGVARELAAAFGRPLKVPDVRLQEGDPAADSRATVEIETFDDCLRYGARVVLGVRVGPSPAWMADLLGAIGLRPLNNIVDITNFVLWELGHPLHAFDLDKLRGARILVRRARRGETLLTLDGIDRRLEPHDLVIADEQRAVALAGIMGGADTMIEAGATDVLLEGAWFDPLTVRRTAQRLALHTDASHRFERRPAVDGMVAALDRAAGLIAEIAGGRVCAGLIDVAGPLPERTTVRLSTARANRLLGIELSDSRIAEVLERLGFEPRPADGGFEVTVPYRRPDVSRPEDLIEEVARHHGYDRLPATLPALPPTDDAGQVEVLAERRVKRLCAAAGFRESMTMSLSSAADQQPFLPDGVTPVALANPLSEALAVLRTHLLPGMLRTVAHNVNRGAAHLRLFEIGRRFYPAGAARAGCGESGREGTAANDTEARSRARNTGQHSARRETGDDGQRSFRSEAGHADDNPVDEHNALAFVVCGSREPFHPWSASEQELDLFDLKGSITEIGARMGWPPWHWEPGEHPGLERGQTALLSSVSGSGWAGCVASDVAATFGIDIPVWVAELDVDQLLRMPAPHHLYRPLPRFPGGVRDLSVLLSDDVLYAAVAEAIESVDDVPLDNHELIDIYEGDDLPDGHHGMTLRFTYRAPDRTLTAAEIDAAHQAMTDVLEARLGAKRR